MAIENVSIVEKCETVFRFVISGRPDSSVGSVFSSDLLDTCTSATEARFSLASLTKISISETIIKMGPAVVCINGRLSPPRFRWFHGAFPGRRLKTTLVFPNH